LHVIGIKAAKYLKSLFGSGKGADSKLRLAHEPQPPAAPIETARLLCEQAQVAGEARFPCTFHILLKIPRHDRERLTIVRFESGQQLEDRAVLADRGKRRSKGLDKCC
jgi:hypothetical protein